MSIEEQIKIMTACGEGKAIEFRPIGAETWFSVIDPLWNWEVMEYRIKPEKKLRPYTKEELLTAIRAHGPMI